MAQLVYACRFEVAGEASCDTIVAPAYETWITERYQRLYKVDLSIDLANCLVRGALPEHHLVRPERFEADETAISVAWTFPGEQSLIWRNTIRFAQLTDRCVVEHQVNIHSADYLVAPATFSVGAPGVVRRICEQHVVQVGEMRIRAVAYPLVADAVDQFVALLTSAERKLPIVFVTPFANGDPSEIDANALATRLAGVAVVTQANDPAATRALSERVGRFGCYDGAVRIYWPGLTLDDDLRRHPLMFGSRIAILGASRAERSIERSIFSVAAFRFVPDSRIDDIVAAAESTRRASRLAVAREEGDATWEKYALELATEVDTLKAENGNLKSENANLKANQEVLFAWSDDETPVDDEEIVRDPKTVEESVEFGVVDFENLNFLDSSRTAAAGSPFKRPGEVYEMLSKMNKVAGVWRRNQGRGDLRQMLINEGAGRRVSNSISQTTRGKWGDEYTFEYQGERKLFEWHVTLGAGAADTCISIHFLPDSVAGKLVIGHVGRHLSNTST